MKNKIIKSKTRDTGEHKERNNEKDAATKYSTFGQPSHNKREKKMKKMCRRKQWRSDDRELPKIKERFKSLIEWHLRYQRSCQNSKSLHQAKPEAQNRKWEESADILVMLASKMCLDKLFVLKDRNCTEMWV